MPTTFTSKVILFIQYRYLSLCQRTLLKCSYQDILTFVQYRCYGNEGRGKCDGLSCTWLLYGHVITPWTENMQFCEWGELRIHWNNVTWWNMSIHFELDDSTIWIVLAVHIRGWKNSRSVMLIILYCIVKYIAILEH